MTTSPSQQQQRLSPTEALRFWLLAGIVFLMVIAGTMLLFSMAYLDDLGTLRNAPELVWNFVCGRPTENNITLPLLLTVSIVCVLASVGLGSWRWWLGYTDEKRKRHPDD